MIPIDFANASTNTINETRRQQDIHRSNQRQPYEGLRQKYGTIQTVHETQPLITASYDDGTYACGGQFILLNHNVDEIVQTWGTVRTGMRVLITYTGTYGDNANATIVGGEGENTANKAQLPNDSPLDFYRMCAPGLGV